MLWLDAAPNPPKGPSFWNACAPALRNENSAIYIESGNKKDLPFEALDPKPPGPNWFEKAFALAWALDCWKGWANKGCWNPPKPPPCELMENSCNFVRARLNSLIRLWKWVMPWPFKEGELQRLSLNIQLPWNLPKEKSNKTCLSVPVYLRKRGIPCVIVNASARCCGYQLSDVQNNNCQKNHHDWEVVSVALANKLIRVPAIFASMGPLLEAGIPKFCYTRKTPRSSYEKGFV